MRILYITSGLDDAGPYFELATKTARFHASQLVLRGLFQALRDGRDEVVFVNLREETEVERALARGEGRKKEDPMGRASSRMSTAKKRLKRALYLMAPGVKSLLYDNLITLPRHLRAIEKAEPDVIVGRDASAVATCTLARLKRIPCIVHMDGLWEAEARFGTNDTLDSRLISRLFGWLLRAYGTRFAVITQAIRNYLVEHGFPPEKITVLGNGVDTRMFHPDVEPHPIAQSLKGKIVVGFVGSFRPWHKIDDFLESIPALIRTNPAIVFIFLGKGPQWDRVDVLANDPEISSHVVLLGPVPHEEVPSVIACFDIGVIPYTVRSCSPLKIYEYMAMAKATVAPRWPSVETIIKDGVDGYLFQPDDMESLRLHILRLADDPELRKRVGRQARKKMVERFAWSRPASRFRHACEAAMNGTS